MAHRDALLARSKMPASHEIEPTTTADPASLKSDEAAHFDQQDRRLAAWMIAAQAGDHSAYEALLRACIPFIKLVARRQGVPTDFTDDVVQETLITIHRVRHTYDPGRSFTAWLRTIAQRRAIDVVRSQGRNFLREVHEPLAFENHSDPAINPEYEANQMDRKSFLGVAVAALSARQRQPVEQLVLNGKSLADAAAATGLAMGALKVNPHRALKSLRARMGAEYRFDGQT